MARDNFKKGEIVKLSQRVAQRCSNPDCRVPTAAPGKTELCVNSMGVAAHIHAASPGGARYDPSMSPKERGSLSNAIWLCSNCSIIIDRDESSYSSELLMEWKEKAEETAIKEQGKKLPSEEDAISLTTMALTGCPQKFLPTAISNVHNATKKAIEKTDPRFEVVTHYNDGKTYFEYRAKEDVSFNLEVKGKEGVEILRRLFEEGEDAKLPAKYFDVKGFDFPAASIKEASLLEIKQNGFKAIQKVWMVDPDTKIIDQFNDVHGDTYVGTKFMRFEGSACSGIFSLSYSQPIVGNGEGSKLNVSVNFPEWDGETLTKLRYFNKIKDLLNKLVSGWELHTALEVHGENVFKARANNLYESPEVLNVYGIMLYIDGARVIAEKIKDSICFKSDFSYTKEEALKVRDISRVLRGEMVFRASQTKKNARFSLILDCDGKEFKEKIKLSDVSNLKIVEEGGAVTIFGEKVSLPNKNTHIKSVYIQSLDDLDKARSGDEISFECIPADGYEFSCEYDFKALDSV